MLPVAPDGQDPNLGVLLFVASRSLEQRAHDAIIAAGFTDITQAQARAAARIDPDGTRVSELAERAQITKQSAAFLVGLCRERLDTAKLRVTEIVADLDETTGS